MRSRGSLLRGCGISGAADNILFCTEGLVPLRKFAVLELIQQDGYLQRVT
jgi:hypothetical protein